VITNPLLIREALCRTRTDDPFLTMVGRLSGPVTPGPTRSPEVAPQAATEDPSGPPERPQDAPTSRALAGLEKLLAIARGDWSDPDRMPDGDPPGTCDWGYCDQPATAWRWAEEHGGWLPVCAEHATASSADGMFCCDHCGGMFELDPEHDPKAEAEAVFRPEELDGAAVLCEECWQAMRAAIPDLDARYQEHEL
jgi:hypothetical protein